MSSAPFAKRLQARMTRLPEGHLSWLAYIGLAPGTTVRVCHLPGKSSGSCWRCLELGLVVVPSCACLVASSPDAPGAVEGPARGFREQPARFGDRDSDHAHVSGTVLAAADAELAVCA